MIRSATTIDAEAISRVHRVARQAAMPWLPVVHTEDEDLAYFRGVVLPNQVVDVFTRQSEVVAFIAVADGWVNHLYLHPVVWRQGIGSRLLSRFQETEDRLQL